MKKIKILLFVLLGWISLTSAQGKEFTYQDIIFNSYGKLAPKNLSQLNWVKGGDFYYYVSGDSLILSSLDNMRKVITLNDVNASVNDLGIDSLRYFPRIKEIKNDRIYFLANNNSLSFDYEKNKLRIINKLPKNSENIFLSPNKKMTAYTIKNNLYLSTQDSPEIPITSEADSNIVSGQSVSRNEFGITHGIFWSPKSDKIAFYQKDESAVTNYPLVDITTRPAHLKNIKYPMNGQGSEVVSVGVYDIATGKTVFLKTSGEKNQYLTCVTWGPEAKYIYIAHLNRLQNRMRLVKYDAISGDEVKELFTESSDKYVEPEHDLVFIPGKPNRFLWYSERDGWQHLYLYNTEGKLLKQVTKGEWAVLGIAGFTSEGDVLFYATKDSPIEENLYKASLETGKVWRVTAANGVHRVKFNSSNGLLIDNYTNLKTPRVIDIIDENGKTIKNLLTAKNPIKDYKLGKQKVFTIKNAEGTKLYCRITYPVDFDSTKKYPAIVYVYGGPHVQLVKNRWGYGRYAFWFQKMAQKGYFVFTLDNRGSDNRGLAFEQATWHHLGTKEIEDQLTGVKYLKSLPYIDSTRFGVFGWSYGGFMTTSLMLRTNNTFKVGVAGGAVIDWRYYEVMYGERYMGTDATNHEGMEESSLLNYVQNLKGKFLMVHGTMDPTVVWQHTLMFLSKATHLNKRLDYYPYVGSQHGVYGIDAVNLYQKLTEYFLNNL